jgi:photosystem II stability/assembly factor-like uncharacterized protein
MTIGKINFGFGLLLLGFAILLLEGCTGGSDSNKDDNNNPANGWATTGSPFGGEVVGFAADDTARALGEVWAAGKVGNVFYSSDYGVNWTLRSTGLPERCTIQCMGGFSGTLTPVLVALVADTLSLSGVYYWDSTNGIWRQSTGLPAPTSSLSYRVIYVLDTFRAYVAVNNSAPASSSRMYVSNDAGQSWSLLGGTNGQTTGMTPDTINDFVATDTSTFYLANATALYNSTNSGSSWAAYGTLSGNPLSGVNRLGFNGALAMAGRNNGVYRYDAGIWTKIDSDNDPISWLSLHPSSISEMYIGRNNSVRLGYAGTAIFDQTNINFDERNSIPLEGQAIDSLQVSALLVAYVGGVGSPHVIYRGSPIYGVLYSNSGGTSFARQNSGLANTTVNNLLVDANNSANLIAGTASGLYRSDDNGANWSHVAINDSGNYYRQNCYVSTRDSNFQYFFVGTNNGIGGGALYTYDRSSGNWTLERDIFTSPIIAVASLSNASLTSSALVLATQNADTGNQVWYGLKNTTWSWTGLGNPTATCLAAARYSTTAGDSIIYAGTLSGVRQFAGSATWNLQSNNISINAVQSLAVSNSTDVVNCYVLAGFANDGMYRRTNATSGAVWTNLNTDLTTTGSQQIFAVNLVNPGNTFLEQFKIYLATNDRVWYSSNGGTDWEIRQTNLSKTAIRAVAGATSNADNVYMMTYNGHVYWSTSGGK